MSFLNKYKQWNPQLLLRTDNILDFVLSRDNTKSIVVNNKLTTNNLLAFIDMDNNLCIDANNKLHSLSEYYWNDAKNDGLLLKNIGFTGIDNGLINYRKDIVSNEEYLNILTKSTLRIFPDDKRLHFSPVYSNSRFYSFPYSIETGEERKYVSLKGGFFQGFFKSCEYEVLPKTINSTWGVEFVLRPMDYEENEKTLNSTHEENDGIFFYIGTRAENKFLNLYSYDFSDFEKRYEDDVDESCLEDGFYSGEKEEECSKYFEDDYFSGNSSITNDNCLIYFNDDYLSKDISLNDVEVKDENGNDIDMEGYYEIETNNKFLIYNNTENGFTTETWDDNDKFILTGVSKNNKENLFLLLNNTETGYTTDNIDEFLNRKQNEKPNLKKDIVNNAFALRIRKDGSIGYRYIESDCESDYGFKIVEEYSHPSVVSKGEWNAIHAKLINENNFLKIKIYVNGYLKFISKSLEMFNFRELDEVLDKQEAVPFNISIGGGTQGLCDSIWLNNFKPFKYILPIEKYFAGTFIGDVASFKFYNRDLESNEIKNNFIFGS